VNNTLAMVRKRTFALGSVILTLTLTLTLAATATFSLLMGSASGVQGRVLDSQAATVYVDPDAQSVLPCGTLTVAVAIRDLPENLAAYQFTMGFNPDVVTVTDVVDARFPGGFVPEPAIGENTVRFSAFIMEPGTDDDGVLAELELEVVGSGTSDLILSDVKLQLWSDGVFEPIPWEVEHGAVEAKKDASQFAFEAVPSPQMVGVPFDVTISALDEDGDPVASFSGIVELSDTTGSLAPTGIYFDGPEVTASVTIANAEQGVTITAQAPNLCGVTISGESNPFDVQSSRIFLPIVTRRTGG